MWTSHLGAFIVNEPRTMCTLMKYYSPMILKNDYMSCKNYNLIESFSICCILMNFHQNEFCAISICFIGHKVYSKDWIVQCVHGVKILNVFLSYVKSNH
jgi:hypothetical protein